MSIESLRSTYGFTRAPFGRDIPPQALHAHRGHKEAVARITYCIAESTIGVITGECGSGKTVAARAAVAGLDASRHTTIYLGTPGVGLRGLYSGIVSGLGGVPRFHRASLIPQTQDLIAAESAERGKAVVVICDESHLLEAEVLEGLRCLSNDTGMDAEARFSLIVLGQPTLRRRLRLGTFAAFDQRVGIRYAIAPLDPAECASYITCHLKFAGRSDTLFSDDAVSLICQVSRGLPRVVNTLAVQSLVAAFSAKKAIVDESSARDAVAEVTAE
jgi:type II secretory pathway predicted ATPase ExeA